MQSSILENLSNKKNNSYVPPKPEFQTKEIAYQRYLKNKEYYKKQLAELFEQKRKYEEEIIPQIDKIRQIALDKGFVDSNGNQIELNEDSYIKEKMYFEDDIGVIDKPVEYMSKQEYKQYKME